jgi:hypothetical protein
MNQDNKQSFGLLRGLFFHLKMEAICSSETSVNFHHTKGVTAQKIAQFKITAVKT